MANVRLTPEQKTALLEDYEQRLAACVPWNPATKWQEKLNFVGSTYEVLELFPGMAASDAPVDTLPRGQYADSPNREFRYCVRLHRTGRPLLTWWGSQVGTVIFDSDVIIPALFQARNQDDPGEGHWSDHPWMSLTPGEILTLRPGTRMAKGRVVIAGLGLGHQLIEVSKRLQVKHITLIELDQELVDWLLPQIKPHVRKRLDVIVGDAFEILPKLKADVALVDIFPGYGNAQAHMDRMATIAPRIKKWWGWGAAEMSGRKLRG